LDRDAHGEVAGRFPHLLEGADERGDRDELLDLLDLDLFLGGLFLGGFFVIRSEG
jgi:hypothetical protein